MKSTILLTAALFLMSAPSPDSQVVSEFSGGFLIPNSDIGLMASETISDAQSWSDTSALENKPSSQIEATTQSSTTCVVSRENC